MGEERFDIRTYSRFEIDMRHPRACDISLRDVARGLAMQCRFNGHVTTFYSVAEHSIAVAEHLARGGAPRDVQRAGLLHDAAEAYLGDVISPVKRLLRQLVSPSPFDELEARWLEAIGARFTVQLTPLSGAVERADRDLLEYEKRVLVEGAMRPEIGMPWHVAESAFLQAASALGIE